MCAVDEDRTLEVPGDLQGTEVFLQEFTPSLLDGVSEIVLSPGVAMEHPVVKAAAERSIPLVSELELAYRYAEGSIIAVTGTNGKSTTVSMIGKILEEDGREVRVAGNVGVPFSSVAQDLGPDGFYVLEVSSFQLETIDSFHPVSAGILNLTPDHLDRYAEAEQYYSIKSRIIMNCGEDDLFFYNADDPRCARIASEFRGMKVPFSSSRAIAGGVFLERRHLIRTGREGKEEIFAEKDDLSVVGLHNIENALAAVASLERFGVAAESCRRALRDFRGLEHRMEKVAEKEGVIFFNDSKATNVEAAVKSLIGLDSPVILIAGGYDKGSDYSKLAEVAGRLKLIVTIGAAAPLIEKAMEGVADTLRAGSMEDAVRMASSAAAPGDLVVLSPACASFDMFRNFEHRGDVFRECVSRIGERV